VSEDESRCLVLEQNGLVLEEHRRRNAHRAPNARASRDLHEHRAEDIRRALDDKAVRLQKYHAAGTPTVLLLDVDDVVLSNRDVVADAFATAAATWGQRGAVDEVYLVDSGRRPVWIYPLKLGDRLYPDLHEFRESFSEQFHTNYKE
jgi:hypothetical protein